MDDKLETTAALLNEVCDIKGIRHRSGGGVFSIRDGRLTFKSTEPYSDLDQHGNTVKELCARRKKQLVASLARHFEPLGLPAPQSVVETDEPGGMEGTLHVITATYPAVLNTQPVMDGCVALINEWLGEQVTANVKKLPLDIIKLLPPLETAKMAAGFITSVKNIYPPEQQQAFMNAVRDEMTRGSVRIAPREQKAGGIS